MPYLIRKRNGEFCVFKKGTNGEPEGKSLGCHATRAEASAQLRALYVNTKEASEADLPESVERSPEPSPELYEKYYRLISGTRADLSYYFPEIFRRPPVRILLPGTLDEFGDIARTPLRRLSGAYASTLATEGLHVFTPRHQRDMTAFDGVLNAGDSHEIDAVKTIVHEVTHLGLKSPPRDRGERILVEGTTELTTLAWVARVFPHRGDEETLAASLRTNAFYANLFPWMSDIYLALAGDGENALKLAYAVLNAPPLVALTTLSQILSEWSGMREPDAKDYLETKTDKYDDRLNALREKLAAAAQKAMASDSRKVRDSLHWLIGYVGDRHETRRIA